MSASISRDVRAGRSPSWRASSRTSWRTSWRALTSALSPARQGVGLALAVVLLPAITAALWPARAHLTLADELLIYLLAIVGLAAVGGIVAALPAAIAASLLLNYFFTPPVHRWAISDPENLLALVLFVVVAGAVSATVHLAAARAAQAAAHNRESVTLLELARTVLDGEDGPGAVLAHLYATSGLSSRLIERTDGRWIVVCAAGPDNVAAPTSFDQALDAAFLTRADLCLEVFGAADSNPRLLSAFAAQATAALDRERLRVQAAQTESLAEANRIRTALLTAVSHDLRTPLASVKASVSSLRQADLHLNGDDRAELLATIEEGADRLDALIANLLDLSRLQTGSLQPFLRPTSLEEIAPLTLRGLDDAERVGLDIPEDLPLLRADPGLLDRIMANLISNALRYSPVGLPPLIRARASGSAVMVEVIDHGSGIKPGQHEKIFEAFQRLGDRRGGSGVGLGLAVARGFAEAMGAQLTARDTPGGGLTMRLRLIAEPASSAVDSALETHR